MKFTTYLFLAITAATSISAAPAPGPEPEADLAARRQHENFDRAACKNACDKGADSVEAICKTISYPMVRTACGLAAHEAQSPSSQGLCVAFCDGWHKFDDWMDAHV